MSKSNYEQYKELKVYFDFEYRGFNMGQVMASELIMYVYENRNYKIYGSLKNFVKYLDLTKFFNHLECENLFTYSINRKDYKELIDKYIQRLKLDNYNLYMVPSNNIKFKFDIMNSLNSLKLLFKYPNLKLKDIFYLASILNMYKITIDTLLKINVKLPNNYYAFNSSFGFEILLTLYFRKKGIKTYSLQHGVYYNFLKPIPLDIINYENLTADKMLCWGLYSIDEMEKFGVKRDRLILFGNPKYDAYKNFIREGKNFERCLIVLSQYKNEEGNQNLIEIVSRLTNIHFDIKLHPTLNWKKYKSIIDNYSHICLLGSNVLITELFDKPYDFILTYNTSVHYEAILNGKLAFGLGLNSDGGILFEKFSSLKELNELISIYQNKNLKDIDKEMSHFASYTLGVKHGR